MGAVPGGVGLMPSPGHCPALEVWYDDRTLRGYFFSQYRPRAPGDSLGRDYFFEFDSTGGSVEIVRGEEDMVRAAADPDWWRQHLQLAAILFRNGDHAAGIAELQKMLAIAPHDPLLHFNIGACYETTGDRNQAEQWFRRAYALPGASAELQAIARQDWGPQE
jgi:tetratricopeptide (TPR) repeat protein